MPEKEEVVRRVVELDHRHIGWGFGERAPRIHPPARKGWHSGAEIDPFPCYPHDFKLVCDVATLCEQAFPLEHEPLYCLPLYECTSRTNGESHEDAIYEGGTGKVLGWEATIYLWGKRIPPHPAMTRYLVAHEYGHLVQHQVERNRGLTARNDQLRDEYLQLREGGKRSYGAGHWHSNMGELIANDFRICILGIEQEFWPHKGFEHPMNLPEVQKFWQEAATENFQALEKRNAKEAETSAKGSD